MDLGLLARSAGVEAVRKGGRFDGRHWPRRRMGRMSVPLIDVQSGAMLNAACQFCILAVALALGR
jgi:hypothetical protein